MRIAVFGANGPTGREVVRQGLEAGHEITALTRHPESFDLRGDGLRVEQGDVLRPDVARRVIEGQDAVISSLGVPYSRRPVHLFSEGTIAVIQGMQAAGVRRLVAVTSIVLAEGREGSFLTDRVLAPLLDGVIGRTVYADMRRMEAAVRASGLDWTIVRPAALANAPASGRPRLEEDFVPGGTTSRADLGAVLLAQITDPAYVRKVAAVITPGLKVSPLTIIRESNTR